MNTTTKLSPAQKARITRDKKKREAREAELAPLIESTARRLEAGDVLRETTYGYQFGKDDDVDSRVIERLIRTERAKYDGDTVVHSTPEEYRIERERINKIARHNKDRRFAYYRRIVRDSKTDDELNAALEWIIEESGTHMLDDEFNEPSQP